MTPKHSSPPAPPAPRHPMTTIEAAAILKLHNQWRRGEINDLLSQNPTAIGVAIDVAIEAMESTSSQIISNQLRVIEYIYATVCGSCISMNRRVELERIKLKIMEGKV